MTFAIQSFSPVRAASWQEAATIIGDKVPKQLLEKMDGVLSLIGLQGSVVSLYSVVSLAELKIRSDVITEAKALPNTEDTTEEPIETLQEIEVSDLGDQVFMYDEAFLIEPISIDEVPGSFLDVHFESSGTGKPSLLRDIKDVTLFQEGNNVYGLMAYGIRRPFPSTDWLLASVIYNQGTATFNRILDNLRKRVNQHANLLPEGTAPNFDSWFIFGIVERTSLVAVKRPIFSGQNAS